MGGGGAAQLLLPEISAPHGTRSSQHQDRPSPARTGLSQQVSGTGQPPPHRSLPYPGLSPMPTPGPRFASGEHKELRHGGLRSAITALQNPAPVRLGPSIPRAAPRTPSPPRSASPRRAAAHGSPRTPPPLQPLRAPLSPGPTAPTRPPPHTHRAPHLCARPPRSERRGIPGLRRQRRRRRKEEEEEEKAEEAPNPGGAAPQLRTLRPHRAPGRQLPPRRRPRTAPQPPPAPTLFPAAPPPPTVRTAHCLRAALPAPLRGSARRGGSLSDAAPGLPPPAPGGRRSSGGTRPPPVGLIAMGVGMGRPRRRSPPAGAIIPPQKSPWMGAWSPPGLRAPTFLCSGTRFVQGEVTWRGPGLCPHSQLFLPRSGCFGAGV